MKIALGSDHAGYNLKRNIHEFLEKEGYKKAKDLLGKVKQWLENDEEFMAYYNRRINGM